MASKGDTQICSVNLEDYASTTSESSSDEETVASSHGWHKHDGHGHHGNQRRFRRGHCYQDKNEYWNHSGRSGSRSGSCDKGVAKRWKKSMKEAKKYKKEAKKYKKAAKCAFKGKRHGCGKVWKHAACGEEKLANDLKDDIYVYMGDYMANEVSVTLIGGQVKITGTHDSGETCCRPHSVVHTYTAPKDAQRNWLKAVLFPRGMLHVRYLEPSELPVEPMELPVGDEMTAASDAIAAINVDDQQQL